mgnify:CR=1 FL=1
MVQSRAQAQLLEKARAGHRDGGRDADLLRTAAADLGPRPRVIQLWQYMTPAQIFAQIENRATDSSRKAR